MQTLFLERTEGKIAFDICGTGPLVIGVPGMGDLRAEYRLLAPRMAAAGFSFASMDVRGHGETDTRWSDYSVGAIGTDIAALIRHLNAPRAIVIGTSMGAGAAVCAAAQAPGLVSGLVLVGPFVRDMKGNPFMERFLQILFADPWGATTWGMYYNSLYPTRKPDDFAAYLANLKRNLRETGRLGALRRMLAASKAASEAALEKLDTPALVLMGTRDPDFKNPEAEAQLITERSRGTYRMVEGAGHYPHAEMPDTVAPEIIAFAKQCTEQNQNDTPRRADT